MPLQGDILVPLISAGSGLLGVAVGGYFAAHNLKRERQQHFLREQLSEFYGPMLAWRALVPAKSETRMKMSGAADAAWRELISRAQEIGIDEVQKVSASRFPLFEKIIKDNNHQLAEEIIPAYRRMQDLCVTKMYLAERSTREHFVAFTEFVEVWTRWLADAIPGEVVQELGHSEEKLVPFYQDLAANFERLQRSLRER